MTEDEPAAALAPAARSSFLQRVVRADAVVAPLLLFLLVYVGTLAVLFWTRFPFAQWTGLLAVSLATLFSVFVWEQGRWTLGFAARPLQILADLSTGTLFGAALIGICGLLVAWTTPVWHGPGLGFPWKELALVFVPAAVHEELLFRGYVFQKLRQWRRGFAILFLAIVFALLHAGNEAVSHIGLFNIFLGGILLALAYERRMRLWFPIALHLAWNVMSGPVLGHEVSGYESMHTVLVERGGGPVWLTGGDFGIEGSIWMTGIELLAIALLMRPAAAPESTAQAVLE
jgi:uncharacterized protein